MSNVFRKILIVVAFFVLAGGSFGIGMLLAQKKIVAEKNSREKAILSQKSEEDAVENITENPENYATVIENTNTSENPTPEPEKKEDIKFSFAIVGDTQNDPNNPAGNLTQASKNINKQDVSFVLALGDLVSSCDGGKECEGKLAKWRSFFKKTVYPVQGNHDRIGEKKADGAWQNFFNLPTNGPEDFSELVYSFDYANSHFVALDSDKPEESLINGKQRAWLEADLAKNKQKNVFVFFHEPTYPTNSKIGEGLDTNPKDRDALWAILKKYKVTAVFSGHEHIASRRKVDGIYQFIFGNTDTFNHLPPKPGTAEYSFVGSTYGIVEVVNEQITVKTFSVNETLLNSFTIPSVTP